MTMQMTTIPMTTRLPARGEQEIAVAVRSLAEWLRLAAAPAFAIMALVTAVFGGGPSDLFCSAMQHGSPLGGMVWMYTLMSVLHAGPWLTLAAGLAKDAGRP